LHALVAGEREFQRFVLAVRRSSRRCCAGHAIVTRALHRNCAPPAPCLSRRRA